MSDVSVFEMLIISLFFITASNCALTYFCCNKSLKILESEKSIGKAVNKLRFMDQYVLSKINMLVALFYLCLSYFLVKSEFPNTDYVFLLSCVFSFPFTLITVYASRVCYCYTCNILLETKLNELECFIVNLKGLLVFYFPFSLVSFIVPSVYLLDVSEMLKLILCSCSMIITLIAWVIMTPKLTILNYDAVEIEKNTLLRYRLEKLMQKHGIKNYKLYKYDSSRSKESNAMVSGVFCYHLFISSCLIEDITLPELETVITHEIGHIKNKHLSKLMFGKLLIISVLSLLILTPNIFNVSRFWFYGSALLVALVGIPASIAIERNYENEADMYATAYNDPELFSSALRKISKYEYEEEKSKIDELFQSHPDIKERIEKVKQGEK